MTTEEIFNNLKAKFGEAILEAKLDVLQPWILIAPDRTREICLFMRDEQSMQFDYLMCW